MKINAFLVACTLFAGHLCFAQNDTLRVLAIGNSFSQDAVEQNLHEIAASKGRVFVIGNMYIGGCTLERHYRNACGNAAEYDYRKITADGSFSNTKSFTLEKALADEKWDVVTLQQASGRSGLPDSYDPFLRELILFVRARVPADARLYWHQTWAYDNGAVHNEFPAYQCSTDAMYEAIAGASRMYCGKYSLGVIPSGTAVQNLRSYEYTLTRDGFHLSTGVGRYPAALTWYEALTGDSVVGCSYRPAGVSELRAAKAQEAVHNAVQHPFEVNEVQSDRITNYDEDKVPSYTLPDALTMSDGRKVRSVRQWENERRPELLELFTTEEFGRAPGRPDNLSFELLESSGDALGGLATRKQVRVRYGSRGNDYMTLLIYIPNGAEGPVPAFLGMNFCGNVAVCDDPAILMPELSKISSYGICELKDRGESAENWCVETLMKSGYALVTFPREDVDPDYDDNFANGVQGAFLKKGEVPAPDEWGTIAGWAWGMSRALDYLETDPMVDATKVIAIGHSRLGKTALWAAASDRRFAMAVSNDSGCGGAAISRRRFGETLEIINQAFPHWFCDNFNKYRDNEDALPFDQHELIALIAPRPVYVASATEDLWADPVGEGIAAKEAAKVYRLWGKKAGQKIGRHIRPGGHAILEYDWVRYIEHADKWVK